MGAFESNPVFVDVDPNLVYGLYDFPWEEYDPYLQKHMEVMPKLAEVGQKTLICGPESFTPDAMPLFGQSEVYILLALHRLLFIYIWFRLRVFT